MELLKVTDPALLDDSYWVLEAGAASLNENTSCRWFAPRMYADILNGVMDMYVVRMRGDTVGFALVSLEDGSFMINAAYIDPHATGADLCDMARQAQAVAAEIGAKDVRLKTTREGGFIRALAPIGFEIAHVELVAPVMEVEYGQ